MKRSPDKAGGTVATTIPTTVKGFSLVELVVTIAVFGILMSIAIPSYRAYIIRSNRADAQTVLLQAAQVMERNFTANDTYKQSGNQPQTTATLGYSQAPSSPGSTAIYNISIPVNTTTYYKLQATPVSTGVNKTDGYLTIDSTGVKAWDKDNSGSINGSTENTWNP